MSEVLWAEEKGELIQPDLQHEACRITLGGRLHICPLNPEKGHLKVLDIGTGTGVWAIEFGETYPSTEVLGVDLSTMQPKESVYSFAAATERFIEC